MWCDYKVKINFRMLKHQTVTNAYYALWFCASDIYVTRWRWAFLFEGERLIDWRVTLAQLSWILPPSYGASRLRKERYLHEATNVIANARAGATTPRSVSGIEFHHSLDFRPTAPTVKVSWNCYVETRPLHPPRSSTRHFDEMFISTTNCRKRKSKVDFRFQAEANISFSYEAERRITKLETWEHKSGMIWFRNTSDCER